MWWGGIVVVGNLGGGVLSGGVLWWGVTEWGGNVGAPISLIYGLIMINSYLTTSPLIF